MARYLLAVLLVAPVVAELGHSGSNYGYGPSLEVVDREEGKEGAQVSNSELMDAVYEANYEDRLFSRENGFMEVGADHELDYARLGSNFTEMEVPAMGQGFMHIPGGRPRVVTPSRADLALLDRKVYCGFAGAKKSGPPRPDQFLDCPRPLPTAFSDVGDLTGHWARRVKIGPITLQRTERIEQCEDRIIISTPEVVHDFVHADGSWNMGVNDVKASRVPSCVPYEASGTWDNGCLEIRTRKQVGGVSTSMLPSFTGKLMPPDEIYCKGSLDGNIIRVYSILGWTTLYRVNKEGKQIYHKDGLFRGLPHIIKRPGEPDGWRSSEEREFADGSKNPKDPKKWDTVE